MSTPSLIKIAASITAGIFLGVIAALTWNTAFIYAVIDYEVKANDWLGFLGALLGAAATLIAAITAYSLAKRASDAQKQRELISALAILPSDLNGIIDYLKDSRTALVTMLDCIRVDAERPLVDKPTYPTDELLRLGKIVSLASPSEAEVFAKLLHEIQIQRARLTGDIDCFNKTGADHATRVLVSSSLDGSFTSIIKVYVQVSNIFPYARLQETSLKPVKYNLENVHNAMFLLHVDDTNDHNLSERIYSQLGINPRPTDPTD